MGLEETPSDALPEVLAVGRTDVTTIVVSMAARHPDGRDAEYLAWHTLDHRPEQHRLAGLRGSLRLVSTPECRSWRAVSDPRYDAVDHVMTYLFADANALEPFGALGAALARGGRRPLRLPTVELGAYRLSGTGAAPRVRAGADVIPWRPARGAYVVVERGSAPAAGLVDISGVAGVWWGSGIPAGRLSSADTGGLQITYCFLDDDPCATAARLDDALRARWATDAVEPLFAAPFHTVVPFEWERHLP
jgi:hypothetical protein